MSNKVKQWKNRNKDHVNEYHKNYYHDHKEDFNEKAKAYYEKNRENILKKAKEKYEMKKKGIVVQKQQERKIREVSLLDYSTKEIGTPPKIAEAVDIRLPQGGTYRAWIQHKTMQIHYVTLFLGGGSESEPIFKINHKFTNEEEAITYACAMIYKEGL
jgi:hypothetical protein